MAQRELTAIQTESAKPVYPGLACLSDDEVMAHLQAGADDALAVLFDRYHRLVHSIALRIVRDDGEAEDVTQIVFMDVFRAAARFDPSRGTTKVWLLQYAYHRALSRKRYLNVRRFYQLEEDEQAADVPLTGLAFGLTPLELRDLLSRGLARHGGLQRDV
ncbi:MAG: sigma factor, partial [Gammaproteobacteria bacterium]